MVTIFKQCRLALLTLLMAVGLSGCVGPAGVVNAPFWTTAPVVEGAQPPASPVAAIGRAQAFAGMQGTEAQRCGKGMEEADRMYRQSQNIDERVELGARQFGWNGNRRTVQTRTQSDIVCVRAGTQVPRGGGQ